MTRIKYIKQKDYTESKHWYLVNNNLYKIYINDNSLYLKSISNNLTLIEKDVTISKAKKLAKKYLTDNKVKFYDGIRLK